jgi:hypothetical protein
MLEEIAQVPCSKGPAAAQKVNRFEKARLTGSVRPKKVVSARSQVDIDIDETTDGANPDALQRH